MTRRIALLARGRPVGVHGVVESILALALSMAPVLWPSTAPAQATAAGSASAAKAESATPKAAGATPEAAGATSPKAAGATPPRASAPTQAAPAIAPNWEVAVQQYTAIGTLLAADSVVGLRARASALDSALGTALPAGTPEPDAQRWRGARASAKALADSAATLGAARQRFGRLSADFIALVSTRYQPRVGSPTYAVYFCPMVPARWIQTAETPANPYYGAQMLTCGTRESVLGPPPNPGDGASPPRAPATPPGGEPHR